MARNVFISYATSDRLTVDRIKRDLEKAGHHIWIYPEALQVGDHIVNSEKIGIDRCDLVLLMWSKASEQRKSVQEEIQFVKERESVTGKKCLLIVKVDRELPVFHSEGVQYCDLSDDAVYAFNFHTLLQKIDSHRAYTIRKQVVPDRTARGWNQITLSLEGNLSRVREVDYHLHMDIATDQNTVDNSDRRNQNFKLKFYSPDNDVVFVVVRFLDDTTEEIRVETLGAP